MSDAMLVLADPTRRELLRLVWHGEVGAGELAEHFSTTFGAVSQHLGKLREAGLVTVRREGKRRLYRADKARLGPLAAALEQMWAVQLDVLKQMVEAEQKQLDAKASARARGARVTKRAMKRGGK